MKLRQFIRLWGINLILKVMWRAVKRWTKMEYMHGCQKPDIVECHTALQAKTHSFFSSEELYGVTTHLCMSELQKFCWRSILFCPFLFWKWRWDFCVNELFIRFQLLSPLVHFENIQLSLLVWIYSQVVLSIGLPLLLLQLILKMLEIWGWSWSWELILASMECFKSLCPEVSWSSQACPYTGFYCASFSISIENKTKLQEGVSFYLWQYLKSVLGAGCESYFPFLYSFLWNKWP